MTQDCNEWFVDLLKQNDFYSKYLFFSTCVSGQWSCSQLDCSRTCSILRNTHYTTFSGQYLKVNSGSCDFTAARLKDNGNKFDLTLTNKQDHLLEGRLTIDGMSYRMFVCLL
jgi:hypothetical protein